MADKPFRMAGDPATDFKAVDLNDGTYALAVKPQGTQPVYDASGSSVIEYNLTLVNANTEYAQALPANARKAAFRCRTGATIRYAWAPGKVAGPTTPYQTLAGGAEYQLDGVNLADATLYFASATAGVAVELEVWT